MKVDTPGGGIYCYHTQLLPFPLWCYGGCIFMLLLQLIYKLFSVPICKGFLFYLLKIDLPMQYFLIGYIIISRPFILFWGWDFVEITEHKLFSVYLVYLITIYKKYSGIYVSFHIHFNTQSSHINYRHSGTFIIYV